MMRATNTVSRSSPPFRFGKRRRGPDDLIRFTDTITAPDSDSDEEPLPRAWTVYPSAKWGYGGATTQALLFDLHQIWKTQGFRGMRIYFGTLRSLYQLQHPGKNPSTLDYTRLRRDLDILCGYEFDCVNAFWDPVSRTYGDMRSWHLFTGWYEATRARASDPQEELPFGFVELSETFAKIAQERGFFVTGFDSAFFHSLRPVEQRLVLYLSKMFVSQELHRRHEAELYEALPIEAARVTKRRQTLRDAVQGIVQKGYSNLASFSLKGAARTDGMVATFRRGEKVEQDQPVRGPTLERLPETVRLLVEDVVAETGDPDSVPMWTRAVPRPGGGGGALRARGPSLGAAPAGSVRGRGRDQECGGLAHHQAHGDGRGARDRHYPPRRGDAPVVISEGPSGIIPCRVMRRLAFRGNLCLPCQCRSRRREEAIWQVLRCSE